MSNSEKDTNNLENLASEITEEPNLSDEAQSTPSPGGYVPDFGTLTCNPPDLKVDKNTPFHLVVMGDFSGRANRMAIYNKDELSGLKGHMVDVDTMEDLPARFNIQLDLDLAGDNESIPYEIRSMDAFHPDEIMDEIELFDELRSMRQALKNPSTFNNAANTINDWLENQGKQPIRRKKALGSDVPADKKLSDFSALIDRQVVERHEAVDLSDMLGKIVTPYITPADDPQLDDYLDIVEGAMTTTLRQILHHPDFQALESVWRAVEMLCRRVETSSSLKITIYDISAEDFAADLSATSAMEETGLYSLLVENPIQDQKGSTPSAIIGLYTFDMTPPHAELLGRMAKVCAHVHAPFITSLDRHNTTRDYEKLPSITERTWKELKAQPESNYIGLTLPRFMLRLPYGTKTDPIDAFDFEEFDEKTGLKSMLWGNSAILLSIVLGVDYVKNHGDMKPGSILSVNEIPFHYVHDQYGDQIALPCTDRLLSHRAIEPLIRNNFIPILAIKGQPEIRIASLKGLAGNTITGRWGEQITVAAPKERPQPVSAKGDTGEDKKVVTGTSGGGKETLRTTFVIEDSEPAQTAENKETTTSEPEEPDHDVDLNESAENLNDISSDDDFDLDSLLAEGDSSNEEGDSGQSELDDLLADISASDDEPTSDDDGMDPELEALLADL